MRPDKDSHDNSAVDQLGHYHDHELAQVDAALQGSIEPLSDKSVTAINRLARYKPPPDPCAHLSCRVWTSRTAADPPSHLLPSPSPRPGLFVRPHKDPFPEGRAAVLVCLFGSRQVTSLSSLRVAGSERREEMRGRAS